MIIQLEKNISEDQIQTLKTKLKDISYKGNRVKTQFSDYVICVGKTDFDIR